MATGIVAGLRYPFRGARFVYREHPALVRYWAVPVVLTAAAIVASLWGASVLAPHVTDALFVAPTEESVGGALLRALHTLLRWVISLSLGALGLLLCTALSGILAAPFNDALSRAVERLARGANRPMQAGPGLLVDIGRTLGLELMKFLAYGCVMLPLFVTGFFVPGLGHALNSLFAFLFSVFFLAIDYVDWPASRRGWDLRGRLGALRRFPGTYAGFGLGTWLFLFVPLLNLLFMPAAVAGGTLMFLDLFEDNLKKQE